MLAYYQFSKNNLCTLPSTLGKEKQVNVFLRVLSPSKTLSEISKDPEQLLKHLRQMKNDNTTTFSAALWFMWLFTVYSAPLIFKFYMTNTAQAVNPHLNYEIVSSDRNLTYLIDRATRSELLLKIIPVDTVANLQHLKAILDQKRQLQHEHITILKGKSIWLCRVQAAWWW